MNQLFLLLGNLSAIIVMSVLLFTNIEIYVEDDREQHDKRHMMSVGLVLGIVVNVICVIVSIL